MFDTMISSPHSSDAVQQLGNGRVSNAGQIRTVCPELAQIAAVAPPAPVTPEH
jgi:hypothetical protein